MATRSRAGGDEPRSFVAPAIAVVALGALVGLGAGVDPLLVAAAVVGVAVVLGCMVEPVVSLFLLVAVLPIDTAISPDASAAVTPIKVLGALCIGAFVLRGLLVKGRFDGDATYWLLLAFLVLALVSSLGAVRDVPAAVGTTLRYASFMGFYVIMAQVVTARLIRPVVWALTLAAAGGAAVGIWGYLSGTQLRATLPNTDPNDFAFVLVTTVPVALWLLRETRRRWLVLSLVAVIVGAALLTLSRGGLVGLAAAGLVASVLDRRYRRLVLTGAGILAATALVLLLAFPERVDNSLHAKEEVAGQNVDDRLGAWRLAVQLASERPLGVGPGNYRFVYNERLDTPAGVESINVVHNAYLDIAAEIGVGGALLFVAFLGVSFVRLVSFHRRGVGPPDFAAAALCSLATAMAASLTLSEQYFAPFWVFASFATVLHRAARADAVAAPAAVAAVAAPVPGTAVAVVGGGG